jgi:hypothetical protein
MGGKGGRGERGKRDERDESCTEKEAGIREG